MVTSLKQGRIDVGDVGQTSHEKKTMLQNISRGQHVYLSETEDNMATATYTKLRDGTWGLKVIDTVTVGQTVTVTTKAGAQKSETIGAVLWTGPNYTVCTIVPKPRTGTKSRLSNGRCRECRGPIVDSLHHQAMSGLCGACAFHEYDR